MHDRFNRENHLFTPTRSIVHLKSEISLFVLQNHLNIYCWVSRVQGVIKHFRFLGIYMGKFRNFVQVHFAKREAQSW